jgi:hypothetical protein
MTIENITCTGGGSGFQIGFFTGSCGTLNNFGCTSGSGGTVAVTITGASAGDVITVAIDGNAGANCDYDISATNTVALPIELMSFNCEWASNDVKISWVSASEVNNDYYLVEHSIDAFIWETIDVVDGAGNSNSTLFYSTTHYNVGNGDHYYRLTQVDHDGKYETFKIIGCQKYINDKAVEKIEYYDYMGRQIMIEPHGFVIKKTIYRYGDPTFEKFYISEN